MKVERLRPLRAASCFSGIGAPEIGGPQFEWLWHAEIEKFPAAVMAARFPDSRNLGDVTADDFLQRASAFGPLDLLVGGPPCQDFSVAGLRAGVAGDRGNLSLRFMELAHAIRPRNLLVENVPGWLNMPDNAFGCFLGALVGADDALRSPLDGKWPSAGMVAGPRARAAWRVFDAQYFGVAQRRRRVFVVADFGDGADPAAVLFERKGVSGNTPPRREAGQGTAGTISARTQGGGGLGTDFEIDGGLAAVSTYDRQSSGEYGEAPVASTVSARDYKGASDLIAHSLRGEGFDASEDGTGRGTPIVPVAFTTEQTPKSNLDCALTLTKQSPTGGGQIQSVAVPVAFAHQGGGTQTTLGYDPDSDTSMTLSANQTPAIAFSSKDYGNDATDDLSSILRSMGHDKSHANGGGQMAVAFALRGREEGAVPEIEGDGSRAGALRAASGGSSRDYVSQGWQVRRLTPTECHRLQGFPDDHCAIEYRGKIAADGPQYKSLGNSWAVPNGAWIIGRIAQHQEQAA